MLHPMIAEDKVWLLGRSGVMYVVKAGPEFRQYAESPLGEPSDCTPRLLREKYLYTRKK